MPQASGGMGWLISKTLAILWGIAIIELLLSTVVRGATGYSHALNA